MLPTLRLSSLQNYGVSPGGVGLSSDPAAVDPLAYQNKVKTLLGATLIDYRVLAETSGLLSHDSSPKLHADGAYNASVVLGVQGIGDGQSAARFNALAEDNILSAGYAADFNPDELTLFMFVRITDPTVWSDGVLRTAFYLKTEVDFGGQPSNFIVVYKRSPASVKNYAMWYSTTHDGIASPDIVVPDGSSGDWSFLAMTVSRADDSVKWYFAPQGQVATLIADSSTDFDTLVGFPWQGTINTAKIATTWPNGGGSHIIGDVAHVGLCNVAHPLSVIQQLSTVP